MVDGEEHIIDGEYVLIPEVTETTFWTATMTVGSSGTSRGYSDPGFVDTYGALSPTAVSAPSSDGYSVRSLSLNAAGVLTANFTPAIPSGDEANWILVVGGTEFKFSDVSVRSATVGSVAFGWNDSGLSWTDGQSVSLELLDRRTFTWKILDEVTGTSYTDSEHAGGKTYVYRVRARNAQGFQWHDFYSDWLWDSPVFMEPVPVRQGAETPQGETPAANSAATGAPTIGGTVQVGETLTASTSGISDHDGMDDATFSYQWVRVDGGSEADISGATASTYTLDSADQGKTVRVRVSFNDDAGNEESLTSTATATVAARPTPLTASFESAPSSHDGQAAFTFRLRFSEEVKLSYKTLRDHSFTVTGGTVMRAQRLDKPSNILWRITVVPDSDADVTLILPATEDCGDEGAICTKDSGRPLSNRLELTVSGPSG